MSLGKFSISYFLAGLIFVFFAFPLFFAEAQTENFSFNITPKNPNPNETVYVSISSFSVDLTRANITWELDNELILSGTGEARTSFKTKELGEPSVLRVTAAYSSQDKIVKTLVIQPASVDILWESVDSYTPPFYKGKALAGRESRIKVVAIPEVKSYGGTLYSPKDLVYEWEKGGENQVGAGGFGKQHFSFLHNVLENDPEISVVAKSRDGYSQASGRTVVNFVSPTIGLYKESVREGINFTEELTQKRHRFGGQTSIVAVPYYFSTNSDAVEGLAYNWEINGSRVNNPEKKNRITIQKSGESGGGAQINLSIENITKLFQDATRSFGIELQ
jgi:hypothetical protein